jgi:MbtH protein
VSEEKYMVVENDQGQQSLWPVRSPAPDGWRDTGFHGSRDEALGWMTERWHETAPARLRKQLQDNGFDEAHIAEVMRRNGYE